jgi:structural maintenance of chromosome 1
MHSKDEAGTKTAKLRQEKELVDRHLQADVEALKNLEENLRQLTDRDAQLSQQVQ